MSGVRVDRCGRVVTRMRVDCRRRNVLSRMRIGRRLCWRLARRVVAGVRVLSERLRGQRRPGDGEEKGAIHAGFPSTVRTLKT